MGRNSQQRRADKKRRSAQQRTRAHETGRHSGHDSGGSNAPPRLDPAALDRLLVTAAMCASGRDESKSAFDHAVVTLIAIESQPDPPCRPTTAVAALLQRSLGTLFEHGWQPLDVAHLVKREHTQRAQRLAIALIAVHARTNDAPSRAPHDWLAQLDDLGVYDPDRAAVIGGQPAAVSAWARSAKLDPDEVLTGALQVLSAMLQAPRVQHLGPPPSAWGATNRGTFPTAAGASPTRSGDVDAKALKLIRALLAKAEATTFDAEAETFTAKAQEMMTRHSIDAAVLASAGRGTSLTAGVESRRVHIDNPYADEKAGLLSVIADVNGARSVWSPHAGFSTVMGFPVDLRLTDLLFTSLLVQATRASADATAVHREMRTPSFRRAFLIAFADRIGERLRATRAEASQVAEQHYGAALVPILADREAAVQAAYTEAFPDVEFVRTRRVNASGYHAGRAAADRAHIGAGEAIART